MDFVTNMLGLLLLLICILIIFIFLKDYIRTGAKTEKKNPVTKKKVSTSRVIHYVVRYKGRSVQSGDIDQSQLPVQFGRSENSGNDILIGARMIPDSVLECVHRAWFYIQPNAVGELTVYSADISDNGIKKVSSQKKLQVVHGGQVKKESAVGLVSKITLRENELSVELSVSDGGER
jgi:hypothetical protein